MYDLVQRKRFFRTSIMFAGCFALPIVAAGQTSTFDAGTEGWTVADLPLNALFTNPPTVLSISNPVWNAAGGNPGGNIAWMDQTPDYMTFSAPGAFLGNQAGANGGSIAFDMQVSASDGSSQPGMILVGGGRTVYFVLDPPGSSWTHVVVPLVGTDWYDANGNNLSAAEMQDTRASLEAIYLTADWLTGTETASLDNVSLVPKPVGLPLLAFGGFALLRILRFAPALK
jgi:hypothetical protein